jgi:hypothetical protein
MRSANRVLIPDAEEQTAIGDMPIAPSMMTGVPEADLARAVADRLVTASDGPTEQTFEELRATFGDSPLTMRVTALAALMRR